VRIERVSDQDGAVLRHLARLKIVPGAEAEVEERSPFGGPVWVRLGRRRHPLGTDLAGAVAVTVLSGPAATEATSS
jgi:DtxR family Mn-dependent transcriptional regulator